MRDQHMTERFVEKSSNLLLVTLSEPRIMVLPPHCLHAVLTFETGLHISVRAASSVWLEEMKVIGQRWNSDYAIAVVNEREDLDLLERLLMEFYVDIDLWIQWAANLKRTPTEREEEIMKVFIPYEKALKSWAARVQVLRRKAAKGKGKPRRR